MHMAAVAVGMRAVGWSCDRGSLAFWLAGWRLDAAAADGFEMAGARGLTPSASTILGAFGTVRLLPLPVKLTPQRHSGDTHELTIVPEPPRNLRTHATPPHLHQHPQTLKRLIDGRYRVNFILDNLPVTVYDLLDEVRVGLRREGGRRPCGGRGGRGAGRVPRPGVWRG